LQPYALTLLGNLFKQAAEAYGRQVIVSTQSVPLLDEFEPEDVIVVERTENLHSDGLILLSFPNGLRSILSANCGRRMFLGGDRRKKMSENWFPGPTCLWRIDTIMRRVESGTTLDSACATGTN
jgi:hypothetical protein